MTALTFTGSITIVVASATILTGLVVLLRDRTNSLYRSMFAMAFLLGCWMLANFFSNDVHMSYSTQLLVNRLIFVTSTGAMASVALFFSYFASSSSHTRIRRLFWSVGIYVMLLSTTPYVVNSIKPMMPVTEVVFGSLAVVYFLAVGFFFVASLTIFYRTLKKTRGVARSQLQLIGWSTFLSLLFGVTTNAVFPFFFKSFNISLVGPLFFSIMVFGFAYAIVVKRLFDVRLIIIRSFTYSISLFVIGYLYFFAVRHLPGALEMRLDNESRAFIISICALFFALTFRPLVYVFTSITTRIFYKNDYDEKHVIDELSAIVVSRTQVSEIAGAVVEIIGSALHPHYMYFFDVGNSMQRLASTGGNPSRSFERALLASLERVEDEVTLLEKHKSRWAQTLHRKYAVDAIVRLSSYDQTEGFLVLGYKQSGEAYTTKDLHVLAMSGKTVGLAMSNANKYEEIINFNKTLEKKIKEATARLRYSNVQLSKLNTVKNDFISAASHQLRPQLTSARGFTELLLEDKHLASHEKKYASYTLRSIERMTSIVSGILESASSDDQILQLQPKRFSFSYLVKEELQALFHQMKQKNITIETDILTRVFVVADKQKCREAVFNIIDNAVRYTPEGGKIRVQLGVVASSLTLTITDTGIGLTDRDQKSIFKKYFRSDQARSVQPSGTGIGLYVCKQFIEAHGGTIEVKSKLHKGSSFTLTMPL